MLAKLSKLVDVKSIVTLFFSTTLVLMVLLKIDVSESTFQLFSSAVMLVLGFFFGKNLKDEDIFEGDV